MIRSEYPRPQLVRKSWQNLNGNWQFGFDDQNRGLDDGWQLGNTELPLTINVPFAYQTELSGIHETDAHDIVWYRRSFKIVRHSKQLYRLHFGAVDYYADVFMNGQLVGQHEGGETEFTIDITRQLLTEENVLVVRVVDPHDDETIPRGKQNWEQRPTSIWYTGTTGIWQTVWIEEVAETYIDHLTFTSDFDGGQVQINTELNRYVPNLSLNYVVHFKEQLVAAGKLELTTATTEFSIDLLQQHIFRTNYHRAGWSWTPEHPNLFTIEMTLAVGQQVVDRVSSYFGMRKVSQQHGMIYLNNQPYYQKLVLNQGYWPEGLLTAPSDQSFVKDIQLAKQMGFNGCRLHQKVEDPRFLYWADTLGFLVWGECASTPVYDNSASQRLVSEWSAIIRRDYNHPSIITWVPLNESWGVPNIQRNRQQQHFSQALFHLIHSLDTTRLVISNDGWSQTETDICTLHDYMHGSVDEPEQQAAFVNDLANRESILSLSPAGKRVYADGFKWQHSPVMLTEFGGISYQAADKDSGWGYTNTTTSQQFLQEYRRIIEAVYRSKIIWGYCYTQLTDVEQEVNGLLSYHRQPKVPVENIKAINDQYHLAYLPQ